MQHGTLPLYAVPAEIRRNSSAYRLFFFLLLTQLLLRLFSFFLLGAALRCIALASHEHFAKNVLLLPFFFFLVCAEWRITEKKCLLRTSHIVCRMSFGIQIELHTRSVSVLRLLATPNRIQIFREPIRRRTVCNL